MSKINLAIVPFLMVGIFCLADEPAAPADDGGLMMTHEQMQERMNEMNRRAAERASQRDTEGIGIRQHQTGEQRARREAAIEGNRTRAEMITHQAAIESMIGDIDRQLTQVQRAGRAAEAQLNELLAARQNAIALATTAGQSSFTMLGGGEQITGTINSPGATMAAIQAVEDRYGPAIATARQQVAQFYQQQQQLVHRKAELTSARRAMAHGYSDNIVSLRARARYDQVKALEAQQKSASAEADAVWTALSEQYPGVDVQGIWQNAIEEAAEILGIGDPAAVRKLASHFLYERANATLQQLQSPAASREPMPAPESSPRDLFD